MAKIAKKILVVEDEKPLSRALQLKLKNMGFDVTTAGDGEEALKILENSKFDLLLIDLILPKVDGFTVLKTIQEKKINQPAIVLSNLTQEEDRARVKSLGALDFFVKSNTPIAEVVTKIKTILKI